MKSLQEIQEEVKVWQQHNFPTSTDQEPFEGMVEELGELAHARLKFRQRIREGALKYKLQEDDALGDLLVFMCDYSNKRNVNLLQILNLTWDEVKKRDWIKFPIDGITN